eukprot:TRINITY_DN5392_c0_g3_i1.p1 TRINITY_DN5392_c0_g3~~TRINITY_DN5392_c0_g3_i1.p1  ORF type:complete len:196 (-),score=-9.24 TRINITY_DN5392_c0_g3_i1:31-618(-)
MKLSTIFFDSTVNILSQSNKSHTLQSCQTILNMQMQILLQTLLKNQQHYQQGLTSSKNLIGYQFCKIYQRLIYESTNNDQEFIPALKILQCATKFQNENHFTYYYKIYNKLKFVVLGYFQANGEQCLFIEISHWESVCAFDPKKKKIINTIKVNQFYNPNIHPALKDIFRKSKDCSAPNIHYYTSSTYFTKSYPV